MIGLIKQLKICLQSVAKKQDVFGIFTDWPRQEFDLPDVYAKNFKCSTVVIVMPKGVGGGGGYDRRSADLVPRVLWLFGQRMGASRDSGEFENISIF